MVLGPVVKSITAVPVQSETRCANECFEKPKGTTPSRLSKLLPEHTSAPVAQELPALRDRSAKSGRQRGNRSAPAGSPASVAREAYRRPEEPPPAKGCLAMHGEPHTPSKRCFECRFPTPGWRKFCVHCTTRLVSPRGMRLRAVRSARSFEETREPRRRRTKDRLAHARHHPRHQPQWWS